jgi:hypothetical protein
MNAGVSSETVMIIIIVIQQNDDRRQRESPGWHLRWILLQLSIIEFINLWVDVATQRTL